MDTIKFALAALLSFCLVTTALAEPPCGRECSPKAISRLPVGRVFRPDVTFSNRRPGDPFRAIGLPNYDPNDHAYHDAIDEVNAARRFWGLRPFIRDEGLTRGAKGLAKYRAERLIRGHTHDDYAALPAGCRADASGCGACATWWGWYCCLTEDSARYAGCAWCWGSDGKRYQAIFVRR